MFKEYMNNFIFSVLFKCRTLIRRINPFYEDKIVILDESGVVCNNLLNEANCYFVGPISQVRHFKKPISVVLRNNVYLITLESLI